MRAERDDQGPLNEHNTCPLCDERLKGSCLTQTFQEMEDDDVIVVTVHWTCAWRVVQGHLCARNEKNETDERWIGWEPTTWRNE